MIPQRYPRRALGAFLIGFIVGPSLIAAVLSFGIAMSAIMHADGDAGPLVGFIAQAVAMAWLYTYLVGGLPALLASGWLAARTWLNGTVGFVETVIAAALGGLLTSFLFWPPVSFALPILLTGLSVAAAVACYAVARFTGLLQRPETAPAQ